ncbi:MAG: tRNA (N(6)-L-threonylcarbamoyladenosine(37)-C(2))-methylthiotransferase [Candidatus Woesearchaeota archaeon]
MNKIYIKTFGCSVNLADSESISGILKKNNYNITQNEDEAELIIINTCIVKGPSEVNCLKYIEKIKKLNKKIIVAGCMAQAMPKKLKGISIIGVEQIKNICEVVEETLNDNIVTLIANENFEDRINLPTKKKNKIIEIIPISSGCLGNCSYCIVKKARGELKSYKPEFIINRAKNAINDGAREIWITAQDTGCYGKDINYSLIKLLREIIKITGNYKIRIGMMNPEHVAKFIDELIELLKINKFFKFLHIPLQSANNNVLKNMNRNYNVEDFKKIFLKLKKEIPNITIATDIICGFPKETDEEFLDTINLIKELKPEIVNISRYWKRNYTTSSKMKQHHSKIIKNRSKKLTNEFLWISFENNKKWKNWEGEILINEYGKNENNFIGRNKYYKPVIIDGNYKLGEIIKVKIIKTTDFNLRGIEI